MTERQHINLGAVLSVCVFIGAGVSIYVGSRHREMERAHQPLAPMASATHGGVRSSDEAPGITKAGRGASARSSEHGGADGSERITKRQPAGAVFGAAMRPSAGLAEVHQRTETKVAMDRPSSGAAQERAAAGVPRRGMEGNGNGIEGQGGEVRPDQQTGAADQGRCDADRGVPLAAYETRARESSQAPVRTTKDGELQRSASGIINEHVSGGNPKSRALVGGDEPRRLGRGDTDDPKRAPANANTEGQPRADEASRALEVRGGVAQSGQRVGTPKVAGSNPVAAPSTVTVANSVCLSAVLPELAPQQDTSATFTFVLPEVPNVGQKPVLRSGPIPILNQRATWLISVPFEADGQYQFEAISHPSERPYGPWMVKCSNGGTNAQAETTHGEVLDSASSDIGVSPRKLGGQPAITDVGQAASGSISGGSPQRGSRGVAHTTAQAEGVTDGDQGSQGSARSSQQPDDRRAGGNRSGTGQHGLVGSARDDGPDSEHDRGAETVGLGVPANQRESPDGRGTADGGSERGQRWVSIPPYMPVLATSHTDDAWAVPNRARAAVAADATTTSIDLNSYLNCLPSSKQPWDAEAIDSTQKANLWAASICAKYSPGICTAYRQTLRCRGFLVRGWYNEGKPFIADAAEYICRQGFDSPLYWEAYYVDTITPHPYFYTFGDDRIEVPYTGVLVRRDGQFYIAQLSIGAVGGVVPIWNGLPPVDPGCRVPGAPCRLWFRAPCMVDRPSAVERWIPAEPQRIRPSAGGVE